MTGRPLAAVPGIATSRGRPLPCGEAGPAQSTGRSRHFFYFNSSVTIHTLPQGQSSVTLLHSSCPWRVRKRPGCVLQGERVHSASCSVLLVGFLHTLAPLWPPGGGREAGGLRSQGLSERGPFPAPPHTSTEPHGEVIRPFANDRRGLWAVEDGQMLLISKSY